MYVFRMSSKNVLILNLINQRILDELKHHATTTTTNTIITTFLKLILHSMVHYAYMCKNFFVCLSGRNFYSCSVRNLKQNILELFFVHIDFIDKQGVILTNINRFKFISIKGTNLSHLIRNVVMNKYCEHAVKHTHTHIHKR